MFIIESIRVNCDAAFFLPTNAENPELKKRINKDITKLRDCTFEKMSGHWSAAQKFSRVWNTNI